MQHVFTYGSLMFAAVWKDIVSGDYESEIAILHGFRRLAVVGEAYPVVRPASPGQSVEGLLYRGVSSSDLVCLDQFEGEYYQRQSLEVQVGGRAERAEVYVLRPRFYHIASREGWDPADFERTGLGLFKASYKGFR